MFRLCSKSGEHPDHTGAVSSSEPEPTLGYGEDTAEGEGYDARGLAPTRVTMVTEEAFPYAATAESHYAKEDTDTMQVGRGPLGEL